MNDAINSRKWTAVASVVIFLCIAASYWNSIDTPFLFDDIPATVQNPTIRSLWPIGPILLPPGDYAAVQRRPVVNLSLAVNYAISGDWAWSYHVFNIAAHALAALLLFGVVRRTLLLPTMGDRFKTSAIPLAAAVALLWGVHPLLTDAVTYIIQRTEVLAGLFYLLTLYCIIRGADSPRKRRWYATAIAACFLGIGSKETALTAPLVVMLYDRAFLSDSWKTVFHRRGGVYAAMALGWLFYAALLPYGAEGTGVFGNPGDMYEYLLAQPAVIANYLRLCFWPSPLVFDYGLHRPESAAQVIPYFVFICLLLAVSADAFRHRPWLGFLGLSFFAILAPSSSFIPLLQQTAAEKRMYLPLAIVVILAVIAAYSAGKWLLGRRTVSARRLAYCGAATVAIVAVALMAVTIDRNRDYRSNLSIWRDTVAKVPDSARAHNNLGLALADLGRFDEAIVHYEKTIEMLPSHAEAYNNLGTIYVVRKQFDKAADYYKTALRISPKYAGAHNNLGNVLLAFGRTNEAISHFHAALEEQGNCEDTYNNLGTAFAGIGQYEDALLFFRRAVEINPRFADAHDNLGRVLAGIGRLDEAIVHFQTSVEIRPNNKNTRDNLRRALAQNRAKSRRPKESGVR